MRVISGATSFKQAMRRFHRDERGMEAIETVVLLAVSALVMMGIYWIWEQAEFTAGEGGLKGAVVKIIEGVFEVFEGMQGAGGGGDDGSWWPF